MVCVDGIIVVTSTEVIVTWFIELLLAELNAEESTVLVTVELDLLDGAIVVVLDEELEVDDDVEDSLEVVDDSLELLDSVVLDSLVSLEAEEDLEVVLDNSLEEEDVDDELEEVVLASLKLLVVLLLS